MPSLLEYWPRWSPVTLPRAGDGVLSGPDRSTRPEKPPREGDFINYLNGEYLQGNYAFGTFFKGKPRDYEKIPGLINSILVPILSARGVMKTEIISGVARAIADGLPARFWKYPSIASGELSKYQTAEQWASERETKTGQQVVDVLGYLACGPADLDIKADLQVDVTIGKILQEILKGDPTDKVIGETIRHVYTRRQGNFLIEYEFGPIPTKPDREGLTIEVLYLNPKENNLPLERRTKTKAFSVHVGLWPKEAHDARADTRLGDTHDRQDFCRVGLSVKRGRLYYKLEDENAIAVMERPDGIAEIKGDLTKFMTVVPRMLRINLMHPLPDPSGSGEDYVDFGRFFPLYEDLSLWDLRRMIQAYSDEAKRTGGLKIPDAIKPFVIREILLCLIVDPYLTVQFLRDTGFSLLIPGLADLSFADWQDVLTSDVFATILDQGQIRSVQKGLRTNEVLMNERKIYKYLSFNGPSRFVRALKEIGKLPDSGHSDWFELVTLFEERPHEMVRELESFQLPDTHRAASITIPGGEVIISWPREVPRSPTLVDALEMAQNVLGRGGTARADLGALDSVRVMEVGKHRIESRAQMGLINALNRFPGGLTPRELARLVPLVDFDWQFLFLKLNGFVERRSIRRIDKDSANVGLDLYFLRRRPPRGDLNLLLKNPQFMIHFRAENKYTQRTLARYLTQLVRIKIPPILEILATLTALDFDMLKIKLWPKGSRAVELVQRMLGAYQELY